VKACLIVAVFGRYASPDYSLNIRLAAVESVARLYARQAPVVEEGGREVGGVERAMDWVLAVVEHEGPAGSMLFQYWALQVWSWAADGAHLMTWCGKQKAGHARESNTDECSCCAIHVTDLLPYRGHLLGS
jgi:hypothetical protein